ncbi:hypothetical protein BMS3Bbin01_02506 [bacterium BMS3Bbin01]|nr:hypothetical protein BMS3Bbin01_02506 [bacterium BMS3Bbin01]
MDLIGLQPQRRVLMNRLCVEFVAAGYPGHAASFLRPGKGQDLVCDDVSVPLQRWPDRVTNDVGETLLPRLGCRRVEGSRDPHIQKRILFHRQREQCIELLNRLLARQCRRCPAIDKPFAQTLAHLIEHSSESPVLLDQRLGMLGLLDGQLGDQHGDHRLQPHGVVDRELGRPRLERIGPGGGFEDQHIPGDPFLLAEACLIDRLGSSGEVTKAGDLGILGLSRHLLDLLVEPVISEHHGVRRVGLHRVVPVVVAEPAQFLVHRPPFRHSGSLILTH